uniref:Uncharacterized protein n=1 Tax=Avena sativa TaxID=4498 RepID=A0ACD5Y2K4_AVESA
MASQIGPPSPAITAIGDDLLREIFLRLPSLPSLVRAALTCRTFLHAVRSYPALRRRFQALHPPQLLGLFVGPSCHPSIPPFVPLRSRSDPDLAATVRGSDFLLTRIPQDSGDPGWAIKGCSSGHVLLHNQNTGQIAAYNPVTQALDIFTHPPQETCHPYYLEFHILFSGEDQSLFRVVCVRCRRRRGHTRARVSVFSSDTREWHGFPWVKTSKPQPGDGDEVRHTDKCLLSSYAGTLVNEFDRLVYWKHKGQAYMVLLDTATPPQLSRMDLPPPLKDMDHTQLKLGRSKDGNICMVCPGDSGGAQDRVSLAVWFWRARNDDGVDKWVLHKTVPLSTYIGVVVRLAPSSFRVGIMALVDGIVYLSIERDDNVGCHLLSFCLETETLNNLFQDTFDIHVHPYIMAWPPSLVCNKEDSETKVYVAADGPAGTEETPSVLVSTLQSYKEALINGDGAKAAEIETLILSIEGEKKSLVSKITTLDAELTNARGSISRISAEFYGYKRRTVRDALFAPL